MTNPLELTASNGTHAVRYGVDSPLTGVAAGSEFRVGSDADGIDWALVAANLITASYAANGRHSLECDSCEQPSIYIDADCNSADVAKVADLIEHARYGHVSRRNIIAVSMPTIALDLTGF